MKPGAIQGAIFIILWGGLLRPPGFLQWNHIQGNKSLVTLWPYRVPVFKLCYDVRGNSTDPEQLLIEICPGCGIASEKTFKVVLEIVFLALILGE